MAQAPNPNRKPWDKHKEEKHPNHPNPDPVRRAENINMVWAYKGQGKSFAWIAEVMQMSSETVYRLFKEGRQLHAPPGAEEQRILAIVQLDNLYHDAMELFRGGEDPIRALALADRLLKSRRDLIGLDAPKKFHGILAVQEERELELAGLLRRLEEENERKESAIRSGEVPSRRGPAGHHR